MTSLIKFSCLLTGQHFNTAINSSIKSQKRISIFATAMIVVAGMWGGLGAGIAQRYISGASLPVIILVGILFALIIISIERIIINSDPHWMTFVFRFILALLISYVGSKLITQLLFTADIEIAKKEILINEASERLEAARKGKTDDILRKNDALNTYLKTLQGHGTVQRSKKSEDGTEIMYSTEHRGYGTADQMRKEIKEVEDERAKLRLEDYIIPPAASNGILYELKSLDALLKKDTWPMTGWVRKFIGFFGIVNEATALKTSFMVLILLIELIIVLFKVIYRNDLTDYEKRIQDDNTFFIKIAEHRNERRLQLLENRDELNALDEILKRNKLSTVVD